jgi:hypothetical protein
MERPSLRRYGGAWRPHEELLASAEEDDARSHTLDRRTSWVEHLVWSPSELLQTFDEQPNTIAGINWRADSQELVSACYGQVIF